MMLFRRMREFSDEEHRILLVTCPGHFFTHFFTLAFPAITIPLTTAFGMPLEQVVKLSFLMYLFYGVLALPAGYLADRYPTKPMIVFGIFLMGVGLVMAGSFPHPHVMYAALSLVGVGASIYHPAGLALISRTVRQRGVALGVNGVFGNLGIALAPLVTGLLTWAFGWQSALVILGSTGILTAVLLYRIHVDEDIRPVAARVAPAEMQALRYSLILCVALVLGGIAYRGNMLLLPAYMEHKTTFLADFISRLPIPKGEGTATLAATVLASVVLFAGLLGQIWGGRLADRFDLRRAYFAFQAASLPFLVAMAFTNQGWIVVCAAGYQLFSLGMQPIENSLLAAMTPDRWRSTSYAVKFMLNFGVGAFVVHIIAPINRAWALEGVYVFLSVVVFLMVVSVAALLISSRRVAQVRN